MSIPDRMRAEWNRRAKQDAHFYAGFGRRNQEAQDFLASAQEFMSQFEAEFPRLPPNVAARRALEIGCGPGRLMMALSPHFGEIHGVDISDEMLELARRNLQCVPHGHVHRTSGSDLALFPEENFDFVYSYLVFQHIPSQEVVLNYLREAQRVLKAGGVLCCQVRGVAPLASEMSRETDTWTGCHFNAGEIAQFSREEAFPLVAISGLDTQYLWTTFRKVRPGVGIRDPEQLDLKAVTAAGGGDRSIPTRSRDAAVSLWMDGMSENASLVEYPALFAGREQMGCYLSPVSETGAAQMDVRLPEDIVPGECEVQLTTRGRLISRSHSITVVPAPQLEPGVVSVTDGINLKSRSRIETGGAKVVIENVDQPGTVSFSIGGRPAEHLQYECKDPITSKYEFAFHLTHKSPRGRQLLKVRVDGRELAPIEVDIA